jgi:hypothetical protein
MITHSELYKNIVQSPVKTVRAKFYLHDNSADVDTPIFEGNENSVTLTALGSFNNSGAKKVTAKIVGNQASYVNTLIKIELQVKTEEDFESITLGYYTAYSIEYDIESNISTLEMYDQMQMYALVPYSLEDDFFPCTVTELATKVASLGGITLDPTFSSLPNAGFQITENLWKTIQNTSYRDVINEIAQTTGTTAITSNRMLLFKTFSAVSETVVERNLLKFKLGQKWGNVNSVTLSRQPQQDNILLRNEDDAALNGVYEIGVVNNQILDDDRETLIQPLYDYFVTSTPYLNYYNAELVTEGHGWYQIGDVVTATLDGIDYPILVTEVNLTVDGSIKETVKSVIPTDPSVNSTTAGGILKTLYNTEIKVDKQNNVITSVVEQQNTYENYVNENFTRIQQDLDDVTVSVQDGGGVNQIKNSVGYSLDSDNNLNFWDYDGTAIITTSPDTGSQVAGALSQNRIDFATNAGSITQRVIVKPGGTYNLTFYAKKETQGVATVSLSNNIDNFPVSLDDDTQYDWQRFTIQDVVPSSNYFDITVEIDGDVDIFSITDLMLAKGAVPKPWEQAGGEVANTNVTFDTTGITVKSSVYDGAFTRITPLEFAGYDNSGQKAFALNNDTTEVNRLDIGGDVETTTHQIVFLTSGPNAGMNFVVKG